MYMTAKEASEKWGISDIMKYYNAFDAYHTKQDLSAMEKLFASYVNQRLDMYLNMLR